MKSEKRSSVFYYSLVKSDGGSVRKDFGRSLRELGCIVSHSDDGVGTDFVSMLHHPVEGLLPSLFANVGPFFDVAADDRLQAADNTAPDASCPNHDPAYDSEIFNDLLVLNFNARGYDHMFSCSWSVVSPSFRQLTTDC